MNNPTNEQLHKILFQMENNGLEFEDEMAEYYHGVNITYYYDKQVKGYMCKFIDIIAGSFVKTVPYSKVKLLKSLAKMSVNDFKAQGFDI